MGNKYLNLYFDEIIEMKKTMTYEEIAKKLNITKHMLKYYIKRYCLENEI
ncbi:helix-turn-helix domain-containing protein [Pseudostreptobacillus hongkongensis]|nr:helix-turn-helix domain-containing protein [Pseudostreptobacillus hongkongensis]